MSSAVVVAFLALLAWSEGLPPVLDIARLESLEPVCDADLSMLRERLDTGQLWAQQMVDASVRAPVGLLSETSVQFGDFDECLSVNGPLTPQYCLADISPTFAAKNITRWPSFKWGVCVPASCSPGQLQDSLQRYMNLSGVQGEDNLQVSVPDVACTVPDTVTRPFTQADLIYCLVIGSIFLIVVLATTHEMAVRPKYDGISAPKSILQCLSARHGFYSLFRMDDPIKGLNLTPLYGLHTCTFFFVVMGHRFGAHMFFMHVTNHKDILYMFSGSWIAIWMDHVDLLVDIFFFMSAFLLGVLYFSVLHKKPVNPVLVYINRLCRVVPVYAVVVFFYATLLRQLGDGPLWNMFMGVEQEKCKEYWWTNLLFVNTYVHPEHMCLLQSWYISCDFQLFVVGTLLVYLFYKAPAPAMGVTFIVFVASTVTPFLGTYLYNRPAFLLFFKDFWANPRQHDVFTSVYSQGHYRGTSYLVGLLTGIYVYTRKDDQRLSKSLTYMLEVTGLACVLLVYWSGALFYDPSVTYSRLVNSLYAALYHTAFGIGLAVIIVAWSLGHSTVLSSAFSWQGFVPLSKLSFCVYLVHNIPHFTWVASSRTPVHFNTQEMVSWSIGDVALSLVVSFILFLTVETPVRYLAKFLISGPPPDTELPRTVRPRRDSVIAQNSYDLNKTSLHQKH